MDIDPQQQSPAPQGTEPEDRRSSLLAELKTSVAARHLDQRAKRFFSEQPSRVRSFTGKHWHGLLAVVLLFGAAAAVAPFDRTIDNLFVNHQTELAPLIETTRPFAHAQPTVLIALLVGAIGWRKTGLEIIGGLLWMFALVWLLKLSVGRVRPNGGPFSFPSGDAATAAVMIIPLAIRNWRSLVVTLWVALGVATYRVSHEYHWPSDVLAGLGIGLLSGWIACATYPPRWVFLSRKWWVPLTLLGATLTALGWLGHGKAFVTFLTIYGIPLGLILVLSWLALFGRCCRRRRQSGL